jgi:hypothetical protein
MESDANFKKYLSELCGEMFCFLFDQTGRFGSH